MKKRPHTFAPGSPESKIREVIDACTDCDCCRPPMDPDCGVFELLFHLYDREIDTGDPIDRSDLRSLADLCNFCALCPCPDIRAGLVEAKSRYMARDGVPLRIKLLADVARLGRICGAAPRLANSLFASRDLGGAIRKALGIHRLRKFPAIPKEPFDAHLQSLSLAEKPEKDAPRKVAYFAGCTGRYLFPAVPEAAAAVLERFGASVFFPDQQCCGMPMLLEGNRGETLKKVRRNMQTLSALTEEGFAVVCSCPTCAYMLKMVVSEGAWYSEAFQRSTASDPAYLTVPDRQRSGFSLLSKTLYGGILKDDGYFSTIDPMQRVRVAQNTFDLGEYLEALLDAGAPPDLHALPTSAAYFPPCHQREQQIGRPWQRLLGRVPGLSLSVPEGLFLCCGMGGIMGFKHDFYRASLRQGKALFEAIEALAPERIVTDCLSCRLQFDQALGLPVCHPAEILAEALADRPPPT